eukprot:gene5739-4100_t
MGFLVAVSHRCLYLFSLLSLFSYYVIIIIIIIVVVVRSVNPVSDCSLYFVNVLRRRYSPSVPPSVPTSRPFCFISVSSVVSEGLWHLFLVYRTTHYSTSPIILPLLNIFLLTELLQKCETVVAVFGVIICFILGFFFFIFFLCVCLTFNVFAFFSHSFTQTHSHLLTLKNLFVFTILFLLVVVVVVPHLINAYCISPFSSTSHTTSAKTTQRKQMAHTKHRNDYALLALSSSHSGINPPITTPTHHDLCHLWPATAVLCYAAHYFRPSTNTTFVPTTPYFTYPTPPPYTNPLQSDKDNDDDSYTNTDTPLFRTISAPRSQAGNHISGTSFISMDPTTDEDLLNFPSDSPQLITVDTADTVRTPTPSIEPHQRLAADIVAAHFLSKSVQTLDRTFSLLQSAAQLAPAGDEETEREAQRALRSALETDAAVALASELLAGGGPVPAVRVGAGPATAGDVEEVLLALQGTAPPSARFSAQLCGALLAEPEAAAASPPPSPPRAAKTPAAKGMLRRSGSATGVAAEADAMRRLLHAIAAPLAHPVASHRPPSEEAEPLVSMLSIPMVVCAVPEAKKVPSVPPFATAVPRGLSLTFAFASMATAAPATPPPAPQDAASNTLSGAPAVERANASAEWLLGLQEGEGLSRFRFFAPVEGGSDDTEEACGSVAWFHAIAAALPQQDGPAAAVEWLRAHAGLDEVLVTRHPGDEKEDLLAAVARCAASPGCSDAPAAPWLGVPCAGAPLVVHDVSTGAFYGVDAYTSTSSNNHTMKESSSGDGKRSCFAVLFEYLLSAPGVGSPSSLWDRSAGIGLKDSAADDTTDWIEVTPPELLKSDHAMPREGTMAGGSSHSGTQNALIIYHQQTTSESNIPSISSASHDPSDTSEFALADQQETRAEFPQSVGSFGAQIVEMNQAYCGPFSSEHLIQQADSTSRTPLPDPAKASVTSSSCATLLGANSLTDIKGIPTANQILAAPNNLPAPIPLTEGAGGVQVIGEGSTLPTTSTTHHLSLSDHPKRSLNDISKSVSNDSLCPEAALARGRDVNDVKLSFLQHRLGLQRGIAGVRVSDDVPAEVLLHDLLLLLVVQSLLLHEEKRQPPHKLCVFACQCEMNLVLDLVPVSRLPQDDEGLHEYLEKIQMYYRQRQAEHKQLFPSFASTSTSRLDRQDDDTASKWITTIFSAGHLYPPSLQRTMLSTVPNKSLSNRSRKHNKSRSHRESQMDGTSLSCTKEEQDGLLSSSMSETMYPEVWGVHVGSTPGDRAVVHPGWYLNDQIREMLISVGAAVVVTGSGAATIVFPFITQERLKLLKRFCIVHHPLAAVADLGIVAVNRLADDAILMRSAEKEEMEKRASIVQLGYGHAAASYQKALIRNVCITSEEDLSTSPPQLSPKPPHSKPPGRHRPGLPLPSLPSPSERKSPTDSSLLVACRSPTCGLQVPKGLGLCHSSSPTQRAVRTGRIRCHQHNAVGPPVPSPSSQETTSQAFPYSLTTTTSSTAGTRTQSCDRPSTSRGTRAHHSGGQDGLSFHHGARLPPGVVDTSICNETNGSGTVYNWENYPHSLATQNDSGADNPFNSTTQRTGSSSAYDTRQLNSFTPHPNSNVSARKRIDYGNSRVVLFSTFSAGVELHQWLVSVGHSVTFCSTHKAIKNALHCDMSIYDIVMIEWCHATMPPDIQELLAEQRKVHYYTPIIFYIIADELDGETSEYYPTPSQEHPALPADVERGDIFVGPTLFDALIQRRIYGRGKVRLGRILKDLHGDHSLTLFFYASRGRLAMKRIPLGVITLERMDYLYKEVAIMREMDHRNIVQLSHVTCDTMFLNIFMELCEYTLEYLLQEGFIEQQQECIRQTTVSNNPVAAAPLSPHTPQPRQAAWRNRQGSYAGTQMSNASWESKARHELSAASGRTTLSGILNDALHTATEIARDERMHLVSDDMKWRDSFLHSMAVAGLGDSTAPPPLPPRSSHPSNMRTLVVVEVDTKSLTCHVSQHQLPASLIELFESTFHRNPEKRITAEQLLEHPIANDRGWVQHMYLEVYQLNNHIGTVGGESEDGEEDVIELSMSSGAGRSSGADDGWHRGRFIQHSNFRRVLLFSTVKKQLWSASPLSFVIYLVLFIIFFYFIFFPSAQTRKMEHLVPFQSERNVMKSIFSLVVVFIRVLLFVCFNFYARIKCSCVLTSSLCCFSCFYFEFLFGFLTFFAFKNLFTSPLYIHEDLPVPLSPHSVSVSASWYLHSKRTREETGSIGGNPNSISLPFSVSFIIRGMWEASIAECVADSPSFLLPLYCITISRHTFVFLVVFFIIWRPTIKKTLNVLVVPMLVFMTLKTELLCLPTLRRVWAKGNNRPLLLVGLLAFSISVSFIYIYIYIIIIIIIIFIQQCLFSFFIFGIRKLFLIRILLVFSLDYFFGIVRLYIIACIWCITQQTAQNCTFRDHLPFIDIILFIILSSCSSFLVLIYLLYLFGVVVFCCLLYQPINNALLTALSQLWPAVALLSYALGSLSATETHLPAGPAEALGSLTGPHRSSDHVSEDDTDTTTSSSRQLFQYVSAPHTRPGIHISGTSFISMDPTTDEDLLNFPSDSPQLITVDTADTVRTPTPSIEPHQRLAADIVAAHFLSKSVQTLDRTFSLLQSAAQLAPAGDEETEREAQRALRSALETWERLQGCLPSTRLSDYLLGGVGHGSDAAVALASELLRQVEDLYLLCESEPDLRDLPADPEAARQARLCRLFGETPERMQARFDLLRSCSAGRPEAAPGATAGDVEEVLLALQGTAPPSARFSAQLCGALLAEPEAAAASPPSPPRAAKTPAAKGMLRRSGSATGVAAEADAMRRLLHAIAAPLAHPVASHRPPSEEAEPLVSMLSIPMVVCAVPEAKKVPSVPPFATAVPRGLSLTFAFASMATAAPATPPPAPQDAASNTLSGATAVERANASAEWLLGLQEGEGLSRFRFFAPVEGGSDDTEEACGSVAWFHAIAAALPQQDGPAAAVEWLRAHAGLDEVLVTRHPGDEEDLLAAVARCAASPGCSDAPAAPWLGVPFAGAPLVVHDASTGAFYGVDAYRCGATAVGSRDSAVVVEKKSVAFIFRYVLFPRSGSHLVGKGFKDQQMVGQILEEDTASDEGAANEAAALVREELKRRVENMNAGAVPLQLYLPPRDAVDPPTPPEPPIPSLSSLSHGPSFVYEGCPPEQETGLLFHRSMSSFPLPTGEMTRTFGYQADNCNAREGTASRTPLLDMAVTSMGSSSCATVLGVSSLTGRLTPPLLSQPVDPNLPAPVPLTEGAGGVQGIGEGSTLPTTSTTHHLSLSDHPKFLANDISKSVSNDSLCPEAALARGRDVNDVKLSFLQHRLGLQRGIAGVRVSDDVPAEVLLHDLLLLLVVQSLLLHEEKRQPPHKLCVFACQCEMNLVLDLVPVSRLPQDDEGLHEYLEKIQMYYRQRQAEHKQLFPSFASTSTSRLDRQDDDTASKWITTIFSAGHLHVPTPLTGTTQRGVGCGGNTSIRSIGSRSKKQMRSHKGSQMDTPNISLLRIDSAERTCREIVYPEVWGVHVGSTPGDRAVVHPGWYLNDQIREMLISVGAAVVVTGSGAATIVFPFITQERLKLLKRFCIVHHPLAAVADLGIVAVNRLADDAILMRSAEKEEIEKRASIVQLGYGHAAASYQKALEKSVIIPPEDHIGFTAAPPTPPHQKRSHRTRHGAAPPSPKPIPKGDAASSLLVACRRPSPVPKKKFGFPSYLQLREEMEEGAPTSSGHVEEEDEAEADAEEQDGEREDKTDIRKNGSDCRTHETRTYGSLPPSDVEVSPSSQEALSQLFPCSLTTTTSTNATNRTNSIHVSEGPQTSGATQAPGPTPAHDTESGKVSEERETGAAHQDGQNPVGGAVTAGLYDTKKYDVQPYSSFSVDANVSYLDLHSLPRSGIERQSIEVGITRIAVFASSPCHDFVSWLISISHAVMYTSSAEEVTGVLRCGIGIYDLQRKTHYYVPIFYVFVDKSIPSNAIYPPLNVTRPPLPGDIDPIYFLMGPTFFDACLPKRPTVRARVRLGRILKDLHGDHSLTFQITRRIGSGGFGDVYEVCFYSSRGRLAMKRIPLGVITLERMDYLYKEVAIMREMDHRNIVQLSHVTCDTMFLNIFMELCEYTLEYLLQEGFIEQQQECIRQTTVSNNPVAAAPLSPHAPQPRQAAWRNRQGSYAGTQMSNASWESKARHELSAASGRTTLSGILKETLSSAVGIAREERKQAACEERKIRESLLHGLVVQGVPENWGSQSPPTPPYLASSSSAKRTLLVVEVDTKNLDCHVSQHQLPASLIELFESTFHRNPEKRITAEQLLEHPIANDRGWVQHMYLEVYQLNGRTGTVGGESEDGEDDLIELSMSSGATGMSFLFLFLAALLCGRQDGLSYEWCGVGSEDSFVFALCVSGCFNRRMRKGVMCSPKWVVSFSVLFSQKGERNNHGELERLTEAKMRARFSKAPMIPMKRVCSSIQCCPPNDQFTSFREDDDGLLNKKRKIEKEQVPCASMAQLQHLRGASSSYECWAGKSIRDGLFCLSLGFFLILIVMCRNASQEICNDTITNCPAVNLLFFFYRAFSRCIIFCWGLIRTPTRDTFCPRIFILLLFPLRGLPPSLQIKDFSKSLIYFFFFYPILDRPTVFFFLFLLCFSLHLEIGERSVLLCISTHVLIHLSIALEPREEKIPRLWLDLLVLLLLVCFTSFIYIYGSLRFLRSSDYTRSSRTATTHFLVFVFVFFLDFYRMVQPQRDPLGGAPDPALTAFSGLWSSAAVLQCASAILHYPHILSQQLGVHARPPAAGPEDLAALPSNTKIDDHSLRHTIANEVPLFTPTPPNGISPPGTADVSITTLENVDDPTNPAGLGAEGLTTRTLSSRFVQSTTLDHPHHLRPVQTPEASKSTPDISKLIWKSKSLLSGAHLTSPSMNNQMPTLQAQQHLKPRCVDPAIVLGIHFLDLAHQPAAQKFKVIGRTLGADHYHTDTASNTAPNSDKIKAAAKLLLKVLETWERLQGCLPSTRLSDYLLGALASELLRQVEDLYLLCESEPDLRDLPADPEAARQARLCRLFGETPERMQARFDLLRSCSAGRPEAAPGATAGDVEEVLLALQGTAPPSARFSAQLCGALLAEPEAAAATPPPSPPRAAKTPAAKGMLRRSGSATGVAAEADAMRRLLHAIAAPLAHPVASHRPPSEEAAARRAVDAEEDSALLSMLNIPFVLLTLWGRKGQSPVDSRDAGGGSGDTSPLPLRHHGGAAVEQKDGEDQQPECATHPQALLLTASVPSGHRMTDIGLQQGHSFCPGASSLFLPQARPVEFSLSRATSSCMEEPQRISNMASAREAPSTSSMRSSSIASRLTHRHHGGSPYTLGGPVRHLGSTHRPLPEGHPSMLRENQLLRQPSSSAMDGDSTAARQQQTLSSVGRTLMPGGRLPNPAGETTTIPFDQNAAPLPARPPFATTPSPAPENNYRLQRTMDGFSNTDGAPPQSRDAAALLPDPGTPSGLAGPPAAPQDAASNTLSGATAVERANASAEWLLGLQEGEGLSRFRFFAPVEGGSDDTEEACGSVAWFHAISAALPQQDGPAAAVEWLRAHAGLDEVLVTRHPGDEKEDLLAAVARCAASPGCSDAPAAPWLGVPCAGAPLVVHDVSTGAFYGVDAYTWRTAHVKSEGGFQQHRVALLFRYVLQPSQTSGAPPVGLMTRPSAALSAKEEAAVARPPSVPRQGSGGRGLTPPWRSNTADAPSSTTEWTSESAVEKARSPRHRLEQRSTGAAESGAPSNAMPCTEPGVQQDSVGTSDAVSVSAAISASGAPSSIGTCLWMNQTKVPVNSTGTMAETQLVALSSPGGEGDKSCKNSGGTGALEQMSPVVDGAPKQARPPLLTQSPHLHLPVGLSRKPSSDLHSPNPLQLSDSGHQSFSESAHLLQAGRNVARGLIGVPSSRPPPPSNEAVDSVSPAAVMRGRDVNEIKLSFLQQRLETQRGVSLVCAADDVPSELLVHDLLLLLVTQQFLQHEELHKDVASRGGYCLMINRCETHLVLDIIPRDVVPSSPKELHEYVEKVKQFYTDREAAYLQLFSMPVPVIYTDQKETSTRAKWMAKLLRRSMLHLDSSSISVGAEVTSTSGELMEVPSVAGLRPRTSAQPVRQAGVSPLASHPDPLAAAHTPGPVPVAAAGDTHSIASLPLLPHDTPSPSSQPSGDSNMAEVWALQVSEDLGDHSLIHPKWFISDAIREVLVATGSAVLVTGSGTASIASPFITQDKLELLKQLHIVNQPLSAIADLGIVAVTQMADDAMLMKCAQKEDTGAKANIVHLGYDVAAQNFMAEAMEKSVDIPTLEEVHKQFLEYQADEVKSDGIHKDIRKPAGEEASAKAGVAGTRTTLAQPTSLAPPVTPTAPLLFPRTLVISTEKDTTTAESRKNSKQGAGQDGSAPLPATQGPSPLSTGDDSRMEGGTGRPNLTEDSDGSVEWNTLSRTRAPHAGSKSSPSLSSGLASTAVPGTRNNRSATVSSLLKLVKTASQQEEEEEADGGEDHGTKDAKAVHTATGAVADPAGGGAEPPANQLRGTPAVSGELQSSLSDPRGRFEMIQALLGDANTSFIDYLSLPKKDTAGPRRLDFPYFRELILHVNDCTSYVDWLMGLGHSATHVNTPAQVTGFLLCDLSVYEVIFIEWHVAIMTPRNLQLLERAKEDNFSTPIFYCVLGSNVTPGSSLPPYCPPLPQDVSPVHILYGETIQEAVARQRMSIRAQIRLGRIMQDLRGDDSLLYQVTNRISSGGFGDVYEVSLYASKGRLAMKRIPLGVITLDRMDQLYKEVAIMREMDHRNIVQFSHTNCNKQHLNIFMELCECSLTDILEAGVLPLRFGVNRSDHLLHNSFTSVTPEPSLSHDTPHGGGTKPVMTPGNPSHNASNLPPNRTNTMANINSASEDSRGKRAGLFKFPEAIAALQKARETAILERRRLVAASAAAGRPRSGSPTFRHPSTCWGMAEVPSQSPGGFSSSLNSSLHLTRTVFVIEVDTKRLNLVTTQHQLPASLIELFESTFHRNPEKRITAELLLEHPIANDRDWLQHMFCEVQLLNERIGAMCNENEVDPNQLMELSVSEISGDSSRSDDQL